MRGTDSNPENHDFDLTSLGFPASFNASIPDGIRRFPRFDITGYQGTGIGGELRPNETHSVVATVTKNMGAHALRTGTEFRQYRETERILRQQPDRAVQLRLDLDARPARQLDRRARHRSASRSPRSCLGIPSSGSVTRAAAYDEKSQVWGFFVQDDWRVSAQLTVNFGLRYEYETALAERDNKSVRRLRPDHARRRFRPRPAPPMRSTRPPKSPSAPSTCRAA